MKVSTVLFSAACLFLATHVDCTLPLCDPVEGRQSGDPCHRLEEIDAMMEDARMIIRKLERSENLIESRIDDLRSVDDRSRRRFAGSRGRSNSQVESLLVQLEQVKREISEVETRMEGLRTERVKLLVWQDLLDTAAEREEIDSFLAGEADDGPLDKLSSPASSRSGGENGRNWGIRYTEFARSN